MSAYNGQNVYIALVNRGLDKGSIYVDDVAGPVIYQAPHDLGVIALGNGSALKNMQESGLSRELAKDDKAKYDQAGDSYSENVSISIIGPEFDSYTEAGPINFKAVVKNFGTSVEGSYQVGWNIDGTPQTAVSNTLPLAVGATDTLTLTWAVPTEGSHTAKAWSILATDLNPSNDSSAVLNFEVLPANLVLRERFEGTFPPAGWLTVNRDGGGVTGPWFAGNPTVFTAYEGTGYAGDNFNSANGIYIDDYLITPSIPGSLTEATVDSITFWLRSNFNDPPDPNYADSLQILVSTTGTDTSNFTTLLAYIAVPKTGWTRFAYALPNALNRHVAFRYLIYDGGQTGSNSDYMGLDLVEVTKHTTGPATFALSVAVTDGWNMVSVPGVNPGGQGVSTWWPNRNTLADVFKWTTTYEPVTLTAPREGYWMLHTWRSNIQLSSNTDSSPRPNTCNSRMEYDRRL